MKATEIVPFDMAQMEQACDQMIDRGFAAVRFPISQYIDPVVEGWLEFVDQDSVLKELWTIQGELTDPTEGPDDGWIPRYGTPTEQNPKGTYDDKEFFHYRAYLAAELRRREVKITSRQQRWLRHCAKLDEVCRRELILPIHHGLDRVLSARMGPEALPHFARRWVPPGEQDLWSVLRALHYRAARHWGQELGKLHVDRNCITLHLADGSPGCIVHDGDSESPLTTRRDVVIFFAGRKAQLLTGGQEMPHIKGNSKPVIKGGVIEACKHRIAVPEGAVIGSSRWSLIYFAHCRMGELPAA